jgi:hypothetical protein
MAPQRDTSAIQRNARLQLSRRRPAVTWTADADLLLSDIHGDRSGPTLEQPYQWWSAHS